MSHIRGCPFCGSNDVTCVGGEGIPGLRVFCSGCGGMGPVRSSREIAVHDWNFRPELQDLLGEAYAQYERAVQEQDATRSTDDTATDELINKVKQLIR